MTPLNRLMTAHPAAVGESYFEHMRFALRFAGLLFAAGGAALAHALLPFLFERTASGMIREMHQRTHNRIPQDEQSPANRSAPESA